MNTKDKLYRAFLRIEASEDAAEGKGEIIEEVELASFSSLEEARLYCAHISQKCSPKATGASELLNSMTAADSFTPG